MRGKVTTFSRSQGILSKPASLFYEAEQITGAARKPCPVSIVRNTCKMSSAARLEWRAVQQYSNCSAEAGKVSAVCIKTVHIYI